MKFTIYLLLVIHVFSSYSEIISKCDNVVTFLNERASFTCKSNQNNDFRWYWRKSDSYSYPLYINDEVDKYIVSTIKENGATTSTLMVKNVTMSDAGSFYCVTSSFSEVGYLHVVRYNNPKCNILCSLNELYLKCTFTYSSPKSLSIRLYLNQMLLETSHREETNYNNNNIFHKTYSISLQSCSERMNLRSEIYDVSTGIYLSSKNMNVNSTIMNFETNFVK